VPLLLLNYMHISHEALSDPSQRLVSFQLRGLLTKDSTLVLLFFLLSLSNGVFRVCMNSPSVMFEDKGLQTSQPHNTVPPAITVSIPTVSEPKFNALPFVPRCERVIAGGSVLLEHTFCIKNRLKFRKLKISKS